jgi:hypothetical protein
MSRESVGDMVRSGIFERAERVGRRRVGAVWPHPKGGGGFDLVIDDQLSVSGRIVCTEPKDEEPRRCRRNAACPAGFRARRGFCRPHAHPRRGTRQAVIEFTGGFDRAVFSRGFGRRLSLASE